MDSDLPYLRHIKIIGGTNNNGLNFRQKAKDQQLTSINY